MQLSKRNVLELIGKNKSSYHSCIITSYSFNFVFFENVVLPNLSAANIRNIHLLIDGVSLEETLESTVGQEFIGNSIHKTYSFSPIYQKGVFHPKIMLLLGKKESLVIIGSGNMTASGLNANDEIWGAFHLDNPESHNAPIIAATWQYLQPFLQKVKGFSQQKVEWMSKNSPWLDTVLKKANNITIKDKLNVQFIGNGKNQSIFNFLIEQLPKEETLKELTVISPYFDKQGTLLTALSETFKPNKIICLTDTENGIMPHEFDLNKASNVTFYKWGGSVKEFDEEINRLHAKAFHFQYENQQFLLFGSPNASWQAFGLVNQKPINAEAALFIQTNQKQSLLKALGIKKPSKSEMITVLKPANKNSQAVGTQTKGKRYAFKILHSERLNQELSIFLSKKVVSKSILKAFDSDGLAVFSTEVFPQKEYFMVIIPSQTYVHKIAFFEENDTMISNFMLIHDVALQAKCNPDAKQQRIDELFEKGSVIGGELEELLNYVDFSLVDDTNKIKSKSSDSQRSETSITNNEVEPISLTNEERLKRRGELLQTARSRWQSNNILIADFLTDLLKGIPFTTVEKEEEFEDNEEEAQRMQDGTGEGTISVTTQNLHKNLKHGFQEYKALEKYFKKLFAHVVNWLSNFYDEPTLPIKKEIGIKRETDITLLSNIIISLKLWHQYNGKYFEYGVEDEAKEIMPFFYSGIIYDGETLSSKGFVTNILGTFLLISTKFKNYDKDHINNQKLRQYRQELTGLLTFAILNINWRSSEKKYRNLMLLDVLQMINEAKVDEKFINKLQEELKTYKAKAQLVIRKYSENEKEYFETIIPAFQEWQHLYHNDRKAIIKPITELKTNDIIYKRELGFNLVHKVRTNQLDLIKIGYDLDYRDLPIITKMDYPSKAISF